MASRLDALIEQLHSQKAEALLIEAGNSLFLVRGKATIPLVNAKLTNEHVSALLTDAAPPDVRAAIARGTPVDFDYVSPSGPVHIEFKVVAGKCFARVAPIADIEEAQQPMAF